MTERLKVGMAMRRVNLVTEAAPETPIWEATLPAARPITGRISAELESAILEVLRMQPQAGEGHQANATRRELTIAGLLGRLDVVTAHHLALRLDTRHPDDALAMAFHQRLSVERRNRLRTYLSGARRRAALQR